MRIKFIVVAAYFLLCSCDEPAKQKQEVQAPAPKEVINNNQALTNAVLTVIKAFNNKDQAAIDGLTSKKYGITIIYRTGVFNEYKRRDRLNFAQPVPATFPYPTQLAGQSVTFAKLPKFNCGTMQWDKHGVYCDTITKDTLLSGVPANLIKYRGDNIPASETEFYTQLESNSQRIVVAGEEGNSLVFYLTLINNRWYLTAIDRITTDCSA